MNPRNAHVEQRRRALVLIAGVLMFVEGCAAHRPTHSAPRPPGAIAFTATAYCHGALTAAGVRVRRGIVAADPAVLPMGATIRIEQSGRYDGIYTVMDTGPKVRGRHVDLYVDDCAAAKRFGRRSVRVTVVDAHD
jgi:3D (Asp-Asp-Asp) domain-containing protein